MTKITLSTFLFACSFFVQGQTITVTGSNCNSDATYSYTNDLFGKPIYSSGSTNIFWTGTRWNLQYEVGGGGTSIAYTNTNDTAKPPNTGWTSIANPPCTGTISLTGDVTTIPPLSTEKFTSETQKFHIYAENGTIKTSTTGVTLHVYNSIGQVVENNNLTNGVYLVQSTDGNGTVQMNKIAL